MSSSLALEIIPVVISEHGEEGVVVLGHDEAALAVHVVGLPVRPVKPVHRLVLVRPPPNPGLVLVMPTLARRTHTHVS